MIVEISHFLALLATGLFFLVGCFSFIRSGNIYISNLITRTYSHAFLLLLTSFAIYVWLAITDNFSVAYIASHSNSDLPTFYAFKGPHIQSSGSFLGHFFRLTRGPREVITLAKLTIKTNAIFQ